MNVDDFLAVQAARAEREERREQRFAPPGHPDVTLYLNEATVRLTIWYPEQATGDPRVWGQAARLLREAADIAASMPGGRVAPLFPKVQGIGLDKNDPRL